MTEEKQIIEEKKEAAAIEKEFENLATIEEKLPAVLALMKDALSENKTPDFKKFWEARQYCLILFKNPLPSPVRTAFWQEYIDLSAEAKRLKDLLDEQTSFAIEQIDLAIKTLEEDLKKKDMLIDRMPAVSYPPKCKTLLRNKAFYIEVQGELNLLNVWASRINSLRKEVLKTPMRLKYRNSFFKWLSLLGDQIFPRRKELIKKVSESFQRDVEYFADRNFSEQKAGGPFFALREEIKNLQGMAKVLTLNTTCFSQTRQKLSGCWDILKEQEKEFKAEQQQQKSLYKENRALIDAKIDAAIQKSKEGISQEEADKEIGEITQYMQTLPLSPLDIKEIKRALYQIKEPIFAKEKEAKEAKIKEMEKGIVRHNQEKEKIVEDLKNLIGAKKHTLTDVDLFWQDLQKKMQTLNLSLFEKQRLKKYIGPLKDLILQLQEKEVLKQKKEEAKFLASLQSLLQKQKEHYQEIKQQLEEYRVAIGASGFDFEMALIYRELIDQDRKRLQNFDTKIEQLEDQIAKLDR